jgi:hypothetical protein
MRPWIADLRPSQESDWPDHRGRCAGGARTRPDMESGAVPRWEAGTVGHRRARWCGGWTRERVTGDAGRYLRRIEDRNTVRSADLMKSPRQGSRKYIFGLGE